MSIVIQAIDQMSGPVAAAARGVLSGIGLVTSGVTKSIEVFKKFGSVVAKAFDILKSVLLAPGDSPLVQGIRALLGGVASELDAIGKASRRLGLSTEFLSELRYAAKLNNIEFGGLADAAATAQRNIAQFATFGSGKAKESLKLLGLQLKDQYGQLRNIGDLLPEIADRLQALPLEQRGLAVKGLFGDQAQPFLNLLENGRVGLEASRAEANRVGAIYTKSQTDALERYNDAVTRVSEAWLGLKAKIAVEVAPFVEGFLDRVTNVIAALPPRLATVGRLVKESFSLNSDVRGIAGEQLGQVIAGITNALRVTVVESARIGAQTFLDALIVGFKVVFPAIRDIVLDLASEIGGYVAKQLGQDNPIPKSLTTQLKEARRIAEQEAPHLRLLKEQIDAIGEAISEERRYVVQPYDLRRVQSGLEQSQRLERLYEESNRLQAQLDTSSTAGIADLVRRRNAQILEDGQSVADSIAAWGLNIQGVAVPAIERMNVAWQEAAAIVDRYRVAAAEVGSSEFVGPIEESVREKSLAFESMMKSVTARIGRAAIDNVLFPLGRSIDLLKSLAAQAKATGQFLPELRARQALLRGDENAAALIRFDAQQRGERAGVISQLPANLRAQAETVLQQERRQFEAKIKVGDAVKRLVSEYDAYRDQLERTSDLVETGELKQFQATRQNQQAAAAVRELGDRTKISLQAIKEEYADLPDVTASVADQVKQIMRSLLPDAADTTGTFGDGFLEGLREIAREFEDLQQNGKSFAQSVAGSLRDELGSAIFEIGQRFKDIDKIAQKFFANLFASIGRAASNKLAEGILGAVFKGVGLSLGAASGGVIIPGGIQRFASGGLVPPGEDTIIGVRYGEGVLRQQAMQSIGIPKFHDINRRGAAALGGGGGNVVINMSVTINGAQNPAAIQAQMEQIPRKILDVLRQSPAYRGDMRSALDGG